jgi:MinD superfamily P-loop ATPase
VPQVTHEEGLRLAFASGKGGTGKTTVVTSLAVTLAALGVPVRVLDCDVEEPDAHLFLSPALVSTREVTVPVPMVDEGRCTGCGVCGDVCAFHALVPLGATVLVFPELCHGCGACAFCCPEDAIREQPRRVGVIEAGRAGIIGFAQGRLDVGEAKAPPVIDAVTALADRPTGEVTLIDAPPGTSCPVIAAVRGADLVLLVAEPTPFGAHDLKLAVETLEAIARPAAVVLNRSDGHDAEVEAICGQHGLEIVARIPDDRRIAEAYAQGHTPVTVVPGLFRLYHELWRRVSG